MRVMLPWPWLRPPVEEIVVDSDASEGAGTAALVDSMKASSPAHLKSTVALADDQTLNRLSALQNYGQIKHAAKGKQIGVLLDYDGTLFPIVDDPDQAVMSTAMRRAVKKVAKCFPTAIVTGRCRDKVYDFVKLAGLFYAGSHGMDITGPAKGSKYMKGTQGVLFQPASEFLPMINEVHDTVVEKTRSIPGAKVEHNKFCVSVHFRCVEEDLWDELAEEVRSVLKSYPKLCLTKGRRVLEIRPAIKWDKGKALEFLLSSLGVDLRWAGDEAFMESTKAAVPAPSLTSKSTRISSATELAAGAEATAASLAFRIVTTVILIESYEANSIF